MDRRDLLKTLGAIPGLTLTPITVKDADDAALLVFKTKSSVSQAQAERIKVAAERHLKGTPLEHVRVMVLGEDLDIELIRKPTPR